MNSNAIDNLLLFLFENYQTFLILEIESRCDPQFLQEGFLFQPNKIIIIYNNVA